MRLKAKKTKEKLSSSGAEIEKVAQSLDFHAQNSV